MFRLFIIIIQQVSLDSDLRSDLVLTHDPLLTAWQFIEKSIMFPRKSSKVTGIIGVEIGSLTVW